MKDKAECPRFAMVLVVLALAGAAPADAGGYRLEMTCTNWCGEAGLFLEETVIETDTGEIVSTERLHAGEFVKTIAGGSTSPGFAPDVSGRFQVATAAVGQENQIMIMESILDTATGSTVSRRWLPPKMYKLVKTAAPQSDPAYSSTHQLAGSTFGEGNRAQDFVTILDTATGRAVARARRDTESETRRDIACLPTEQWIQPALERGDYQLSITARGPDDRKALIYETVLDTRDGSVVARRRVHQRAFRIEN